MITTISKKIIPMLKKLASLAYFLTLAFVMVVELDELFEVVH